MGKGAIFIGMAFIIFGIWLTYIVLTGSAPIWVLIYPLISIGIGIALIILYDQENKIEQRKDIKTKE